MRAERVLTVAGIGVLGGVTTTGRTVAAREPVAAATVAAVGTAAAEVAVALPARPIDRIAPIAPRPPRFVETGGAGASNDVVQPDQAPPPLPAPLSGSRPRLSGGSSFFASSLGQEQTQDSPATATRAAGIAAYRKGLGLAPQPMKAGAEILGALVDGSGRAFDFTV